jgi:hypothetical protein
MRLIEERHSARCWGKERTHFEFIIIKQHHEPARLYHAICNNSHGFIMRVPCVSKTRVLCKLIMERGKTEFLHYKKWTYQILLTHTYVVYVGKSVSNLQMDIKLKQIRVLIWKMLLFLNIIFLYIEALFPSCQKPLKTSSIKFFGLLSEPGGDLHLQETFTSWGCYSWCRHLRKCWLLL